MTDMLASRAGQINASGDPDALFLKQFGGEVLTAYRTNTVFAARHVVRTIPNGKSAQFPATWKATARYHTPGTLITGQTIKSGERTIVIDDLLISDVFIASIDEAKTHYEFRAEYTTQVGEALARTYDKNLAQVGILAARASATVSGANGGTQIVSATAGTDVNAFVAAAADAAQAMDEKDVPKNDRALFVRPDQYYQLLASGHKALSTDWSPSSQADAAQGTVRKLFGLEIVPTNNLPAAAVASGPTAYQGDFSNTVALAMHRGAIGTVKLLDLGVDSEYKIEYQGTLIVAKMAVGHGILRPECAVEIASA